ncbi:MAG: hypothetical protein KBC73_20155 [Burkholderiaceae bacterium]|nr:hypothetical protein [Burkholderiaceae bacterium]
MIDALAHPAPEGGGLAPPPLRLLLPRPAPAAPVRLRPGATPARPWWRRWWTAGPQPGR